MANETIDTIISKTILANENLIKSVDSNQPIFMDKSDVKNERKDNEIISNYFSIRFNFFYCSSKMYDKW